MKIQISKYLSIPLLVTVVALGAHTASAAILLADDFSAGTVGWFVNGTSPNSTAALIAIDNTAPLSTNVMQFKDTSSSSVMIANFATTTLGVTGDSITLTADMHHPAAVIGTAPYIGLYDNRGTPFIANLVGATGAEGDDTGFAIMQKKLNADVADFRIYEQIAQGYPHGYTGMIDISDSDILASSNSAYAMTITLTRNASSGLDITAAFGAYSTTYTQPTPATFTFNEVFLMNGLLNGGTHNFDNVLVTTTVGAVAGFPVITNQPAPPAVSAGATATFTVGVSNTVGASYQWQFYGTNILDGGNLSGTTTPTLTVSGVSPSDIGHYRVIVSNASGAATSPDAALAILGNHSSPVVTINGKSGDTYRVDYATALAPATWLPLSTNVLGASQKLVDDTSSPLSNPRFYRASYLAP